MRAADFKSNFLNTPAKNPMPKDKMQSAVALYENTHLVFTLGDFVKMESYSVEV